MQRGRGHATLVLSAQCKVERTTAWINPSGTPRETDCAHWDIACTMPDSDMPLFDTFRKRGPMKSRVWTVLYPYCLRIACFGCTMSFTFVFPVVPFAVLGWLVLGAFFWQDFFPVTWPWGFE